MQEEGHAVSINKSHCASIKFKEDHPTTIYTQLQDVYTSRNRKHYKTTISCQKALGHHLFPNSDHLPTGGNSSCPIAVLRKTILGLDMSLQLWSRVKRLSLFNHECWAVIFESSPWNVTCTSSFFGLWCIAQKSIRSEGTIPKHVQSKSSNCTYSSH